MADGESGAEEVFDVDRVRALIELMKQHDLGEIDLRNGQRRIRLARSQPPAPPAAPMWMPMPPTAAASPPPTAAADSSPPAEEEANIAYITSPMVGTFYARPNPKAERFVKVGDHVEPETNVCIIEAMKVFNEIPAEVRGTLVAVLVDDEEPVEYGTRLFKLDTSK